MSDYIKPLPETQPWSEPFWEGTKAGKLLIQKCDDCGATIFYPRKNCPDCWSSNLSWSESNGKGTVFSYTITLAGVEEKFAGDLPFVLALIDLDDGIRMMSNIVNCPPESVHIGMKVQVVFEKATDEFSLPLWEPV